MTRIFNVAFGSIQVEGLFGQSTSTFEDALRSSWRPRVTITRYRRTWRLSRSHRRGKYILGRLGFVGEAQFTTVDWDEEQEDFEVADAAGGSIVPVAIRTDLRVIAFQLKSGLVRPTSVTGALQALLSQDSDYDWVVRPLYVESSFESWLRTVERVTEARFRIERPNPDWADRPDVERIITDLEAEVARLEARAAEGEALNTSGSLFRQALDHVLRDYGRAVVRGVDAFENETEWVSVAGGTIPVRAEVVSSTDQDEVPEQDLVSAFEDREDELRGLANGGNSNDHEET